MGGRDLSRPCSNFGIESEPRSRRHLHAQTRPRDGRRRAHGCSATPTFADQPESHDGFSQIATRAQSSDMYSCMALTLLPLLHYNPEHSSLLGGRNLSLRVVLSWCNAETSEA